ncbi:hypothetical protein RSOL_507940 [Rhizoctonia solani AG-3 Rhs1AP]|uniref:Uncharacterized protein n=1 Tax=Rhizoctonia solani AG-3 Rhs1AP TaxID=1086054 RepID=X8JSJ4_9AGAM|nr:hypothetical protein RSOL_507940 [Rhizoctonia solani AG-3 Rhs1AP]
MVFLTLRHSRTISVAVSNSRERPVSWVTRLRSLVTPRSSRLHRLFLCPSVMLSI